MDQDLKIADNFFDNPVYIRDHALKQDYRNYVYTGQGIWSGYRAFINNQEIEFELISKLETLNQRKIKNILPRYHLNPKISMHGFPHIDSTNPNFFAGVVYMNQQYPENCGTTIYENLPDHKNDIENYIVNYFDKMEIVYDTTISFYNKYKQQFSKECINFKTQVLKPIKSVEFAFNRAVCYPGNTLHSPDYYFGDTVNTFRLTVVFHGEFE